VTSPWLEPRHEALARRAAEAPLPDSEDVREHVAALGKAGLLACFQVPATDVRAAAVIREALGTRTAIADLGFAMQGLGSGPVRLGGTPDQKAALLPDVAAGKTVMGFALTEPDAGSDLGAVATRARADGGEWVLDGTKVFISNAGVADAYTVLARTSDGPKGLSMFLVRAKEKGVRLVRAFEMLSPHPIGEIAFESCRLPKDALVGEEGQGMRLALGTLDRLRATVGAAAIGMATRALRAAVAHAKSRVQFGKPLAEQQLVQAMIADSATELEAARGLVLRAAWMQDTEPEGRHTAAISMAKLFATEAAGRVADRCVQILGGRGVVKGEVVERVYRDVRALRIYEGTSEIQRLVIAREVLR
jgi:alkylation response protein AidB-like acyl-CoA dehydrogenase